MSSKMMLPIQLTKILYESWEGQISISSQDSEIYGKCLNGPGKVVFKNGNQYQGNFYNGLLHGQGKFIWSNGIVYEGQFTDNRITGKGIYQWPDGSSYEGEVRDGLRHGYGKYCIDEAIYEGEWIEGKKEGKGKIIFKSGSIFQGNFKNDCKEGHGKMYYYPSGNFFEGEWKKDVKSGMGTMNWTDIREKYVGQWQNNQQEGWGIHIWLESKGQGKYLRNRYEGNWKAGVREGFGVFHYANGSRYEGYWKDNMKEGYSFYTNQNGKISLILFSKDRMIKSEKPANFQTENGKKVPNKKEVEPNYYSLCLNIQHFYSPFTPNLDYLFNYLLRNNTLIKSWYKAASSFYDQQSEFSFCLNLEGTWKMIRSLKILGDFSLAQFDRGLQQFNTDIEGLLKITEPIAQDSVSYEDIYFKYLGNSIDYDLELTNITQIQHRPSVQPPFKDDFVHYRQKNLLFRQFVHVLVWMSHNLEPNVEKPQKSLQRLIAKITPFLDSLSKATKASGSENMSQNKSSISKADKNLTPFFRNNNAQVLQYLKPNQARQISRQDLTIKVRQLIGYGKINNCIGEAQYSLLQKIFEKYFDNEVLSREKIGNWQNSSLPTKILNVMNYQLIEFEFVEIIYILFIKKLPTHKQTEENKSKYLDLLKDLFKAKDIQRQNQNELNQYTQETRYIWSQKGEAKIQLQQKRAKLQEKRRLREAKQQQAERENLERNLMAREDFDIKEMEFEEEQSEFQI